MFKISKIISMLYYYILGHLFFYILYDRKYLKSNIFKGKFRGLNAAAWKIVVIDGCSRLFLHKNRGIPFPVNPNSKICNYKNIMFDIDDLNNFHGNGCYFQAWEAKIIIGKGTYIAQNVGIITNNHDIHNLDLRSEGKDVMIGKNCWIGMNAVILPGVRLGNKTIVGAGSIVTKSFNEGNVVIAGNPAKIIKKID